MKPAEPEDIARGNVPWRLFRGDDGEIYYHIGD